MSSTTRKPLIIVPATNPPSDISKSAVFIFLHGLGDDAEGVESIPHTFQTANKLPHLSWILPNAPHNHDLNLAAWYLPTNLSPNPPSRPELEDEEDEQGITTTISYITTLIDEQVASGIPPHRIVLGGFSQGHAIALLTGLVSSKYAGRLGGLVGLSGYLPLVDRIGGLRRAAGLLEKVDGGENVEVFLARGTRDMLVPKRYLALCEKTFLGLGIAPEKLTVKAYEGMGHVIRGDELSDLCRWLEKVVPPVVG
ncbi:acyl-protein thioesterase 1 [Byssothecium circinans]|uniref:Acyl-protein thioesterase 1 n=1 Tax=Byssothecium circinans TaxID=147558 RepID=A0A6A5TV70_9PLEO|nr:acyl-protein thioesterase 1 [Byssothecium circinans]